MYIQSAVGLWREVYKVWRNKEVCIVGDFNFGNIKWTNQTWDHESKEFLGGTIQHNFPTS